MTPIYHWLTGALTTKQFWLLLASTSFMLLNASAIAQNSISVQINQAQVSSTCIGNLAGATGVEYAAWEVNIENEAWQTYGNDACFTTTPNKQFTADLACLGELRGGEIQVCFKVFKNRRSLFDACKIDPSCEENICEYFVLPLVGTEANYNLSIPENLSASGTLDFTISNEGIQNGASNDHICHAIDLGTLEPGKQLGQENLGNFNNFCATAAQEADPKQVNGSFTNNAGVWFSFNTGPAPSELIVIEAFNDPERTGDFINLQLALYQLDTDACNGAITFIKDHHDKVDYDEHLLVECLAPNQQFYILVDGVYDETTLPDIPALFGFFGMRIRNIEVNGENDEICAAIPLTIKEGGTSVYTDFFNNCATSTNDPPIDTFPSFQPVWFQFTPPSTHRALLEVISHQSYPAGIDPIDPQVAVFSSDDETCSGNLKRASHHYDNEEPTNAISMDCLDPTRTYWIMVDGGPKNPTGMFDISISDPGYPALKVQDAVTCQGTTYILGNRTYTAAGTYQDTVLFAEGCLEIIETNLSIADSLSLTVDIIKLSGGLDVSDGAANVLVTGGSGNYSISWSDGTNSDIGKELTGGTTYCISVTDDIGCFLEHCFEMPYVVPIQAILKNDTLDCFGDSNGELIVTIMEGRPPYSYQLMDDADGTMLQSGMMEDTTGSIRFQNLKAGNYMLSLNTANNVLTRIGKVIAPQPIELGIVEQKMASCYGICDASIELVAEGGNGAFDFSWSDEIDRGQSATTICAGNYQVSVHDAKNCQQTLDLTIQEPSAFIAKAMQTKAITCYGETNGEANVIANQAPISFLWDNGSDQAIATSLSAGIHTVIVTNEAHCVDTAFIEIEQAPQLSIEIDILSTINCFGDKDGLLKGIASGGKGDYQYEWDNGNQQALNDELAAGMHQLVITDAAGCTNSASVHLEQPTPLTASLSKENVSCPGGPKSGTIHIDSPSGGIGPYAYSLNGAVFSSAGHFNQLTAGTYEVNIQDANGCAIQETSIIENPPMVAVELGETQTLKLGETVEIIAATNRPVQYQWNISSDSLICNNCPSINMQPMASTTYAVTVTDIASECTATDEVFIAIHNDRDVYVPNAFSPNSDGYNDALMVYGGNDIRRIKTFQIFDRQGTMVYEADNFAPNDASQSWKGDFNGQKLATAIFIYWAEVEFIDGYTEIYKGDIALFR